MPRGRNITERERNFVIDMNAQQTESHHSRFTFAEIATAAGLSERMVALIVRDYAGWARRREHASARMDELCDDSTT